MDDYADKIDSLSKKLDVLLQKQELFRKEINDLNLEISLLKSKRHFQPEPESKAAQIIPEVKQPETEKAAEPVPAPVTEDGKPKEPVAAYKPRPYIPSHEIRSEIKTDWEKFIGENLISKIGIAITVLGVGIGAKYAIDNEMISPLTRIILGYISGLILLGFALKLKRKYENFSAVLLSGSMAIFYFITFSAYNFYQLIPNTVAFGLMFLFTVFTVFSAIQYNRQVIAHIGLIGAYAVPFLLSDGSGRVEIMFGYMAIINSGIIVIAFNKNWKSINYSAFSLTWIIFISWYLMSYDTASHFRLALTFLTIFFVIFYLMFLAYKLIKNEEFDFPDIFVLLVNSFLFYGIGYLTLDDHSAGSQLLGAFTVLNAIIHFIASVVIYRKKLADKKLFYMIIGLVLVFITIAVPVQLDGNWVTLFWSALALALYWVGHSRKVTMYELFAYPIILLAFASLLHDWSFHVPDFGYYGEVKTYKPILNINFLSSLLFSFALGGIFYLGRNKVTGESTDNINTLHKTFSFLIPSTLLFTLYYMFRIEISLYWEQIYDASGILIQENGSSYEYTRYNYDISNFKSLWIINYSLLFFSALGIINIKYLKNKTLYYTNLIFNTLFILTFLTQGLLLISELRDSFLGIYEVSEYPVTKFHLGFRYICFLFLALNLYVSYLYVKPVHFQSNFSKVFDIILHITIIWTASSELIHWLALSGFNNTYKLGLSILWGVYALLLISLGIWKGKKYLRILAFSMMGIVLLKLFLYDISHLNTISKTIVFVSIGVLLLIISFLYNKFKTKLFNESED